MLGEEGPDSRLTRGTGSFVVHGKKASVINFGTGLQNMSQDAMQQTRRDDPSRPSSQQAGSPSSGDDEDYHSAMGDVRGWRGRRESATSASTATARSFRELHRKYSRSASAGARLSVPSDDESDAAVSVSGSGRTPLPRIDHESSDEDGEGAGRSVPERPEYFTPMSEPASPVGNDEKDRGRGVTREAV